MEFRLTKRGNGIEIVPMITVMAILLVFFLLTALLTPTALLDRAPSEASAPPSDALPVFLMDGDGQVAFDGTFGLAQSLARLAEEIELRCASRDCEASPVPITLRADPMASGRSVARLAIEINALGPVTIQLATVAE